MAQDTFVCDWCGRTLPLESEGVSRVRCGMNLGWGSLYGCTDCVSVGTVSEVCAAFESAMNPPRETPPPAAS